MPALAALVALVLATKFGAAAYDIAAESITAGGVTLDAGHPYYLNGDMAICAKYGIVVDAAPA